VPPTLLFGSLYLIVWFRISSLLPCALWRFGLAKRNRHKGPTVNSPPRVRPAWLSKAKTALLAALKEEDWFGKLCFPARQRRTSGLLAVLIQNPGVFLPNFNFSRAQNSEFFSEKEKSKIWRSFQDKVRNYYAQHPEDSL